MQDDRDSAEISLLCTSVFSEPLSHPIPVCSMTETAQKGEGEGGMGGDAAVEQGEDGDGDHHHHLHHHRHQKLTQSWYWGHTSRYFESYASL